MKNIKATTFIDQAVEVSGTIFDQCSFERCELVFDGTEVKMNRCVIVNCSWKYVGAAACTISLLKFKWDIGDRTYIANLVEYITGIPALGHAFRSQPVPKKLKRLN